MPKHRQAAAPARMTSQTANLGDGSLSPVAWSCRRKVPIAVSFALQQTLFLTLLGRMRGNGASRMTVVRSPTSREVTHIQKLYRRIEKSP